MKLSDALVKGKQHVKIQLHGKGYATFQDGEVTGGDALFAAYMGRYSAKGLVRVFDNRRESVTKMCSQIEKSLLRAFPDLGRRLEPIEARSVEKSIGTRPLKGESWVGLICRLNDKENRSIDEISLAVSSAGL